MYRLLAWFGPMARSPGSRGLIPLGHLPGGQATLNSSIAGIADISKEEQRRDRGQNLGYPGYFQDFGVAGVLWDVGRGSDMKWWGAARPRTVAHW